MYIHVVSRTCNVPVHAAKMYIISAVPLESIREVVLASQVLVGSAARSIPLAVGGSYPMHQPARASGRALPGTRSVCDKNSSMLMAIARLSSQLKLAEREGSSTAAQRHSGSHRFQFQRLAGTNIQHELGTERHEGGRIARGAGQAQP